MRSLLEDLAAAVQRAVDGFRGDPGEVVGSGADGLPSARLDVVAERAVLKALERRRVKISVLSEEAGWIDRGRKETLILDPIDGSHNAIRGVPAYSTSIALAQSSLGGVRAGVVRNLATGDVFYAERGKGARLDGRPIRVRPLDGDDTLFDVYLGRNAEPKAAQVAAAARRVRNLGVASLDLCLVARGAADLYYMNAVARARHRLVDIAAGVLIVREAGGQVLDLDGRQLDLPLDPMARTNLIAFGDPRTFERIA